MKQCKSRQIVAKAYPCALTTFPESRLTKGDLADVDRHHQHIQDRAPVGAARIGAPLAGQANAARLGIFEHQLRGGKAAGNIDAVVVAAELEFLVKEEFLNLAMP